MEARGWGRGGPGAPRTGPPADLLGVNKLRRSFESRSLLVPVSGGDVGKSTEAEGQPELPKIQRKEPPAAGRAAGPGDARAAQPAGRPAGRSGRAVARSSPF